MFDINNEVRHTVPPVFTFPLNLTILLLLTSSLCSPLCLPAFPPLFLLGVVFQQCVWLATLPLASKRGGKKLSILLPLTPAKQNSLCSSSPLLHFPLALSSLLGSLSFCLSHSLGILPAHKFLTSHKVSVIQQENKHSASQPVSL